MEPFFEVSTIVSVEVRSFSQKFGFSPRERQVFALLVNNVVTFKDVALRLKVSPNTVHNHFRSIFSKAKVTSKVELLGMFLRYVVLADRVRLPLLRQPRVILVDDEPEFCSVLEERLTKRGVKVHSFCDPQLVASRVDDIRPDAIVTDLRMPHMDGFQLIDQIRQKTTEVPSILVLSGFCNETSAKRFKDFGASAILEKPVDMDQLYSLIMSAYDVAGQSSQTVHSAI